MGKSKKDMKKQKERQDREAGIEKFDPKADKKKANASCSICKQVFIVTSKNVELKAHVDAKHGGSWDTCFPGVAQPS